MNVVSRNNLWTYLQGLSLTKSDQRWLASRLIENSQAKERVVMADEEIKEGLVAAFQQLDEIKKGNCKARKAEDLLNEL